MIKSRDCLTYAIHALMFHGGVAIVHAQGYVCAFVRRVGQLSQIAAEFQAEVTNYLIILIYDSDLCQYRQSR